MADLHPIAKRIHNISPGPLNLTCTDGTEIVLSVSGAEFFQQEFQAEGTHNSDEAQYRLVSSVDNDSILLGKKGPSDREWDIIGSVVDVAPADSN